MIFFIKNIFKALFFAFADIAPVFKQFLLYASPLPDTYLEIPAAARKPAFVVMSA
jgi:hypothetical protein